MSTRENIRLIARAPLTENKKQMPPRFFVFFLYINYVTIFMLVFKSMLLSKTVCLMKKEFSSTPI